MPRKDTPAVYTEGKIFAQRLSLIMKARGLKQDQLANMIQVRRQTISNYMSGQSEPNCTILHDIADALEVSADYLIGLTNTERGINLEENIGLNDAAAEALLFFTTQGQSYTDQVNALLSSKGFVMAIMISESLRERNMELAGNAVNVLSWDITNDQEYAGVLYALSELQDKADFHAYMTAREFEKLAKELVGDDELQKTLRLIQRRLNKYKKSKKDYTTQEAGSDGE